VEELQREAARAREASPGSALGIELDQTGPGRRGGFKIGITVTSPIEPEFSGELDVSTVSMNTGDVTPDGRPVLFFVDSASSNPQGRATLRIDSYDGYWLRGTVSGDFQGGFLLPNKQPARVRFSADFHAGVNNIMRMEVACVAPAPR